MLNPPAAPKRTLLFFGVDRRWWLQRELAVMSVGMSWLVWQGATLDPSLNGHPQAFYLSWPLWLRAGLWAVAGVAALTCSAFRSRRAVDIGYAVLMVMPAQRTGGWAWEAVVAAVQGRWFDAMSTAFITLFWLALLAVVLTANSVSSRDGVS